MHAILTMQTNISIFSGNKEYSQERRIKMCKLSLQTEQARNILHNHRATAVPEEIGSKQSKCTAWIAHQD
jgi:hypothetical protein